jgi:hypothetical protein
MLMLLPAAAAIAVIGLIAVVSAVLGRRRAGGVGHRAGRAATAVESVVSSAKRHELIQTHAVGPTASRTWDRSSDPLERFTDAAELRRARD